MAYPSDIEEELAKQQELEEIKQLERMAALQAQQQEEERKRQQVGEMVRQEAVGRLKRKVVKLAVKRGWMALVGLLGSISAPVWVTILGIIFMAGFVMIFFVSACNMGGVSGIVVRFTLVPPGICEVLGSKPSLPQAEGPSLPQPEPLPGEPTDLVYLWDVGVPTKGNIDDRVRKCMANKVDRLYELSQQRGLDWVVTSAFRSGAVTAEGKPSAHSRGEAIDIAIRPAPTKPWSTNPQIRDLVNLAKSVGFSPPNGDTLDEYNKPTEYATAAHVHIEFNRAGGQIYCDIT